MTEHSRFDVARFRTRLGDASLRLGSPVTAVWETGSTNDDAAHAARQGAPEGTLFVADVQTRGRGRRGHIWTSPPAENLTFSVVLRPAVEAGRVSALTLVAGAALRAALSPLTPQVKIKWPNDVVVQKKKLAGILVESQLTGDHVDAVIIGIGVNVRMTKPPPEIANVATSLALLGSAPPPDREPLLVAILAELEPRLARFVTEGLEPILSEVRAHDALAGRAVTVEHHTGTADGIGPDGSLLLRGPDGVVRSVSSGTVDW